MSGFPDTVVFPTDAERHEMDMMARVEELKAQLAYVRAERDRARADYDALATEVDAWQSLAQRVRTAPTQEERLMAASVLAQGLCSQPHRPCGTCGGHGRVDDGFGVETGCPDCETNS